jgi:alpha,alpha-trehalase
VDLRLSALDAAIFDMDGVITRTAEVHARAWKQLFDEFFAQSETPSPPFDIDRDYRQYVDGKPRYDGVASFLASRGISLPWGAQNDYPGWETVCALGNKKDHYFHELVARDGVSAFESTISLIQQLRLAQLKTGVFTSSRNAAEILAAAHADQLFDARVDGLDAEELGLPGKPFPDVLLELTRQLGANPSRTAVFEDAIAGVQAGKAGGFAVVVGVNRGSLDGELLRHGASDEVKDLSEVSLVS